MRTILSVLPIMMLLAACAAKPDRYVVQPDVLPSTTQTTALTVMIGKLTLPAYAKETSIFVQSERDALVAVPKSDWADDTERAMILSLVRNISDITGAAVAPDPWPLGGIPEAEVSVTVERMFVDKTSTMRLTGQFSIRRDRATSRNRIGQFDINTRAVSKSASDIVAAHADAWRQLAQIIAEEL
ncbi:MAG: ABC-type transport auxiliary lipoprotein family protein [Pseudomonadota bacterium]